MSAAYADSSLLFKLYHFEPESPRAVQTVAAYTPGLLFTELHQLELGSSLRRLTGQGSLSPSEAARALRLLKADLHAGLYLQPSLDWPRVFAQAHRLSRLHSRADLARSLDLLHVACALELRATHFLSFDARQRRVAAAEGMAVLP
jgi:predicted nucleic acid-binding protein